MKKRSRRNLHQYLAPEVDTTDILHSHAIRRVEKKTGPVLPTVRRGSAGKQNVPGYRDSMVGSIAQYRDKLPTAPKEPEAGITPVKDDSIIVGNRPTNGHSRNDVVADKKDKDAASIERRYHFIEPPKRNFNRFS